MNKVIITSLKESLTLIWKSKLIFILLFFLQIIFFISFSLISYNYTPKIIESQKAIYEYVSNLKQDEISIAEDILQQKNILGEDPLLITRNFNEIVKNFKLYLTYIFILLVIFTSISWTITFRLIYGKMFLPLAKTSFILLFYLGLIFLFFYSLFNISFNEIAVEGTKIFTKYIPFLIFSIILIYFMFISLSLINKTELKEIVQKTLKIGIKKAHYILAAYFISILFFALSIFLLIYFIEKNLFILLLSIILLIFSFVFGRIFMVKVVERLD